MYKYYTILRTGLRIYGFVSTRYPGTNTWQILRDGCVYIACGKIYWGVSYELWMQWEDHGSQFSYMSIAVIWMRNVPTVLGFWILGPQLIILFGEIRRCGLAGGHMPLCAGCEPLRHCNSSSVFSLAVPDMNFHLPVPAAMPSAGVHHQSPILWTGSQNELRLLSQQQ